MSRKFRIAYFVHSLRSDWNNGNAHFLRGLLRNLGELGHAVTVYEPAHDWSIDHLLEEPQGQRSLDQFARLYPDLNIVPYSSIQETPWEQLLEDTDVVILHEWNSPELAHALLALRDSLSFRLLFHDTHHRASSSPEQIARYGIDCFDGVLAFGEVLQTIYRDRFGIDRVWVLHEAADTSIFKPSKPADTLDDVVWIGNWGDEERSSEIQQYLLTPAAQLRNRRFTIYGVRYPEHGVSALRSAGVQYGGYLPNLDAPSVYAAARLTVHIPRQQYASIMPGIPTIRVFEALACGIPLISAPWQDSESLFREGDYACVDSSQAMRSKMEHLLNDAAAASAQAARGLETILAHHTCHHRAMQLSEILEEHLS